jgi:hypothetical protein
VKPEMIIKKLYRSVEARVRNREILFRESKSVVKNPRARPENSNKLPKIPRLKNFEQIMPAIKKRTNLTAGNCSTGNLYADLFFTYS